MKFKELLTKIFSGIASDEEKNTFWDCIDTNDELAELLCDAHIPEIMELICENEFIRRKPYFRKYDLICSLYSSNMEIACTFDCEQLKNEIAPFLKVEHIDKLITQLALREAAIKTIIEKKELLKEQLLQLKDKIARTQKAHEKTKEATEKPTFQKKKHPSKQEEQLELLSKELDWVKAQERLLVATYKSPSKMIDYLRAYRDGQSQIVKARFNDLLGNASVSFEIPRGDTVVCDEEVQRLVSENERLIHEKERLSKDCGKLRESLRQLTAESTAQINDLKNKCNNLKVDKEHLEREHAIATTRLAQLEPRVKQLEAQVKEYDQILLTLNGRIYEVLHEPIRELETSYFNLNDFKEPLDPKDIASYFVDAIGKLREGINNIPLNMSKVKILDKEYFISLQSCAEFEDWADRAPIDFDPDKHILMRGKAKQVHVITRGFSYTNNLGNTEVIKAEVRSADSETDELGGTK